MHAGRRRDPFRLSAHPSEDGDARERQGGAFDLWEEHRES